MGIRKRLGLASNANTGIIELESASFVGGMLQILQIWAKSREKTPKEVEKKLKSREKIVILLSQNNTLSAAALARRIGITPKTVEKHIAKLKADGEIKQIGPDKGGHWQLIKK